MKDNKDIPIILTSSKVLGAFGTFYTECRALVPEDKQASLAVARDRLLRALD